MSKNKKVLQMLAKGGMSQAEIAASNHMSKRDVSAAAKILREHNFTFNEICEMDPSVIDDLFIRRSPSKSNDAYLSPDIESYVLRKKKSRKMPVKLFWIEYCENAASKGRLAYSYQMFARMFAEAAEKMDATRHFAHEPGAKCYIDWAGDAAYLTDKITGTKTKIYVLVITLPFSDRLWAEGFCNMRQRSWQDGHVHAFADFGGTPRMWVPDNTATATDRTKPGLTLINKEYERFAEHYGAAIVPARVRRPRDKSVAESSVNLIEQWIIGPARELTFYTLEEFNEYCKDKVRWLNSRPFSAKEGSRDSVFEAEEKEHLLALPGSPYVMCEWRSAKVAPDYHVTVEYMHYSVNHTLIGEHVDVRLTDKTVEMMKDGAVVARHARLYGRRGQYSTSVEHMPENHASLKDPWSPERFISWAKRIGCETEAAIKRVLQSKAIVEQAYVSCRNILGLSKAYTPNLLEEACAKANSSGTVASYTGIKNTILAIKGSRAKSLSNTSADMHITNELLIDRAKSAGRTRGADAYRRAGDR